MNIGMKKSRDLVFCQAWFLLLFIGRIKSKKKSIFFPLYDRTTVGYTMVRQKDVALKVHRPFVRVKEEVIYLSVHLTSVSTNIS